MRTLRSLLFVPGHRPDWIPKAARVAPDAIILDLEDAVPATEKDRARTELAASVRELRDRWPEIHVVVRPNHYETPQGPADLEHAVGAGIDALLLPKVESAEEVARVDAIVEHVGRQSGRGPDIDFIVSLESARGLLGMQNILEHTRVGGALAAAARDGDTARSVGFQWTPAGLETLAWRTQLVVACRALSEMLPLVGLWQDVTDLEGLREFAVNNHALGYQGQVAIHPSHVPVINEVYTPDPGVVSYYQGLIEAVESGEREGTGAVVYEGTHVDAAHVATARQVVALAQSIADRKQE